MTEYGLIIALVAIAVIIALTAMGGKVSAVFDQITSKL
jgi:pilus assembly protein Flp/PilA